MSRILDGGVQALFGSVFGALFLSGTLIRPIREEDGEGGWIMAASAQYPVKGQIEQTDEAMRQSGGYTDMDAKITLLQAGLPVAPNSDDRIFLAGRTWAIVTIKSDPAGAYWSIEASAIQDGSP